MIYRQPQKGLYRPQTKQILNNGLVVICENIVEDTTNPNHSIYAWLETRYTQLEYMRVLEEQLATTEERLVLAEEVLNTILIGGVK